MPTYEYLCDACRHRFEELQSITAKPLRRCPKCGRSRLRRLIGAGAGLIFKGSGFYATDYKTSKSDSKGDAKPEVKPEKKPDSKGEAKASSSDKSCGTCGKTGPDVCD